jgi:hypothetical protein
MVSPAWFVIAEEFVERVRAQIKALEIYGDLVSDAQYNDNIILLYPLIAHEFEDRVIPRDPRFIDEILLIVGDEFEKVNE